MSKQHGFRVAVWPVGGLWWAEKMDIFGKHRTRSGTAFNYFMGMMIYLFFLSFVSTFLLMAVLLISV